MPTPVGTKAAETRRKPRFGEHSIDFPVEPFTIFSGPVLGGGEAMLFARQTGPHVKAGDHFPRVPQGDIILWRPDL